MERTLAFTVKRPRSLVEAAALLAAQPTARIVAGGTDLVPNLRRGIERPPTLVDLSAVQDFDAIVADEEGLWLGAGVTLARLARDARLRADFPVLAEAARSVAGPAHRSVATLGGNLCVDTRCVFFNQSEWWRAANHYCLKRGGDTCHVAPQGARCHAAFCGDVAPALLALDASVETVASRGTRRVALADLYRDDGAAHLALPPGEGHLGLLIAPARGLLVGTPVALGCAVGLLVTVGGLGIAARIAMPAGPTIILLGGVILGLVHLAPRRRLRPERRVAVSGQ